MASELTFVLINPYTIAKSRTGGVIGRIISRTGLGLVGARMFGPGAELAARYAELVRRDADGDPAINGILADYVAHAYAPDPKTGRRHRVLMLLFEGEDAIAKVRNAVGVARPNVETGESVRDTYGDFISDPSGAVRYVEPAVMSATSRASVAAALKLWSEYSEADGGLMTGAADVASGGSVQQTLVILKPDNFRFPSARPGNIIDIFSASGLRIIGAKVHRMSVAEAEEFYGPVRDVLRRKMVGVVAERSAKALAAEFAMEIPDAVRAQVGGVLGPLYGDQQFYSIVQFMTGYWPPSVPAAEKAQAGKERCLILVYAGLGAVDKIRKILGPTDPSKAEPGSVRKEFGKDIMVNAAHASDSPENAEREMRIVKVAEDVITPRIRKHYG